MVLYLIIISVKYLLALVSPADSFAFFLFYYSSLVIYCTQHCLLIFWPVIMVKSVSVVYISGFYTVSVFFLRLPRDESLRSKPDLLSRSFLRKNAKSLSQGLAKMSSGSFRKKPMVLSCSIE